MTISESIPTPAGPWRSSSATMVASWALSSLDVPDPDGSLDLQSEETPDGLLLERLPSIWRFAISFESGRFLPFDDLVLFREMIFEEFNANGLLRLGLSLDALRALLDFEAEYTWRKNRTAPWERNNPREARFVRTLVGAIRQRLVEDEFALENYATVDHERRSRRMDRSNVAADLMRLYLLAADALGEAPDALRVLEEVLTSPPVEADAMRQLPDPSQDTFVRYETAFIRTLAAGLLSAAEGDTPEQRIGNARDEAYRRAEEFKP